MDLDFQAPSETLSNEEFSGIVQKPIPPEIYLRILALLTRTDLATCMRVSGQFNKLIAPTIYRKLDIDLRLPRHPLLNLGKESLIQSVILARKSLNPFSHTTHLSLTAHSNDMCSTFSTLIMPNLEYLRIKQCHPSPGFDACISRAPPKTKTDDTIIIDTCCPLVINLRPKTIELGGTISGFSGSGLGLWTSTQVKFPPPWLENLIINTGWAAEFDHSERSFLRDLPKSIKRLTLVLPKPKEDVEGEIWDERWKWRKGEDAWIDSKHSWVKMARAITGSSEVIEIVGIEKLDGWERWTKNEVEIKAREILTYGMMKGEGWPFLAAQRIVKRVKFVERETYLAI